MAKKPIWNWLPQMPFTDFHQLNLDWIVDTVKEWADKLVDYFEDGGARETIEEVMVEHPEWWPRVMDGSITSAQINSEFLKEIKNAYVTPEMFGAAGDGVTDDTNAWNTTLATGLPVWAENEYKITGNLTIPSNTIIILNGKITITDNYAGIVIAGDDIEIVGGGAVDIINAIYPITNNGNKAERIHISIAEISYDANSTDMIYLRSASSTAPCTRWNVHDMKIVGGSAVDGEIANGITLETSGTGYINENSFRRISTHKTNYAVKMISNANNSMNHNEFLRIEGENSKYQLYAHGSSGITGNTFDFRTGELRRKTNIFDITSRFTGNTLIADRGVTPQQFTNSEETTPAFWSNTGSHVTNKLRGCVQNLSGSVYATDPDFGMNGTNVLFNKGVNNTAAASISRTSHTFDWDGTFNSAWPGYKLYTFTGTGDITIDLNNLSDVSTNPLEYIRFTGSPTTLTIMSGETIVKAQGAVSAGLYRCLYNANRTSISLYKIV